MDNKVLIIRDISTMKSISREIHSKGKKIGFVPTMGFLHEGHLSLIRKANEVSDFVVCSIYVNPAQFAENEDFGSYPRDTDNDIEKAQAAGADLIFLPDSTDMYPAGYNSYVELRRIASKFEGEFRPHFFGGVATICTQLFNIVDPDLTVFGQKDYQQCLVIESLIRDLKFGIDLLIEPTQRESNGLAMSSRNKYLSEEDFEKSSIVFIALQEARKEIEKGEKRRKIINAIMHKTLRSVPEIKIDYASSALADNLDTPEEFLKGDEIVLLVAVYLGKTRLIDNTIVKV